MKEKNLKNWMVVIRLASNYGGAASRMIPAHEATTINKYFPDTLSEFTYWLTDCIEQYLLFDMHPQKIQQVLDALGQEPQQAYNLFKANANLFNKGEYHDR